MASHTVAIAFVRSALTSAQRYGLDVRDALLSAGIAPELIERDSSRVTPAQATRVVQALWASTDDELLGVGPKPVARGTFRMISLGLIHSPDLRTALRRFAEFASLSMGFVATDVTDDGHTTRLTLDPTGQTLTDQLLIDVLVAVSHRFAGWLIGEQIPLTAVQMPYPCPPHSEDYRLIYGIAPVFDSANAAISFDSTYLDAPVIRGEDELFEFIRNSPADLLFRRDYHPTMASRVRRILERGDGASAEQVARRLAISPQHLRRLLREDGTSFRQIREDILRDAAITSLVRGTETIDSLSERLGFSEPSAFRRAFRRWTGSSPGSYRIDSAEPGPSA
ncbi:AraC family transcriptional regulator [Mycobacterium sp. CPCC 205372]|uniref:AraC family transcriptional regulator n=1 Tax=Mycobacterium hippophais TaxID=3016340 RepID=A0ABT4PXJ6_9MYCO|nr:AraC family transcriptional regulator [Mycobacterium hippophais]MCZ8381282.1 AraC family transcriptional regulator [Mycobacterium hippophais]